MQKITSLTIERSVFDLSVRQISRKLECRNESYVCSKYMLMFANILKIKLSKYHGT